MEANGLFTIYSTNPVQSCLLDCQPHTHKCIQTCHNEAKDINDCLSVCDMNRKNCQSICSIENYSNEKDKRIGGIIVLSIVVFLFLTIIAVEIYELKKK